MKNPFKKFFDVKKLKKEVKFLREILELKDDHIDVLNQRIRNSEEITINKGRMLDEKMFDKLLIKKNGKTK